MAPEHTPDYTLTVQAWDDGEWHDVADVTFRQPEKGILGATLLNYRDDWYFHAEPNPGEAPSVIDRRAVSVALPLSQDPVSLPHWPAFLVDMLPQGNARRRSVAALASDGTLAPGADGLPVRADQPSVELPLLRRAGGAPVGNLRLKEAFEEEQARLAEHLRQAPWPPLSDTDIEQRSERLVETVEAFCPQWASGSSAQGEWPKAQMIRTADGRWFPAPLASQLTAEEQASAEWSILKLLRSGSDDDRLILACEAPWLEVARLFGLQTGAPLRYYPSGVLVIPRFDRKTTPQDMICGQESLFSALGQADNSLPLRHEQAISLLARVSRQPLQDICDYVLRDLLNLAMGNPDNHGRNTALLKSSHGVSLSPLFDFAPMCLAADAPPRRMTWDCSPQRLSPDGYVPDWQAVCTTVGQLAGEQNREQNGGEMARDRAEDLAEGLADTLRQALLARRPLLQILPEILDALGVPPPAREKPLARLPALLDSLAALAGEPACPREQDTAVPPPSLLLDPALLDNLVALATKTVEQGAFAQALPLWCLVIDSFQQLCGPEHPDTLTSQNALAVTLRNLGAPGTAHSLQEQILEAQKRILGPEHPHTLTSQNILAATLSDLGDPDAARSLLEQTLEAQKRTLGPEHPDTLNSQNTLAAILYRLGDLDAARSLQEQTLEARKRILGPEHPHTLNSQNNLAATLSDLGDLDAARSLLEQTLGAQKHTLGPEHPDTLNSQNTLAAILSRLGDLDAARSLLEQTLEAQKRILGPEHPDTLNSQNTLAATLSDLGDLDAARSLLEQTLEAQKHTLGPEHPGTLTSQNNLAKTLYRLGDLAAARSLLEQTLEAQKRTLGPEHPHTLSSQGGLIQILMQLGDIPAAQAQMQEMQAVLTRQAARHSEAGRPGERIRAGAAIPGDQAGQ